MQDHNETIERLVKERLEEVAGAIVVARESLGPGELKLINMLTERNEWEDLVLVQRDLRSFNIDIVGFERGTPFSAWLPLATINRADWPSRRIWRHADGYGAPGRLPVQGADWSGIRDSSEEAIWKMFNLAYTDVVR